MSELAPVALFETDEDDRELITYAVSTLIATTHCWCEVLMVLQNERFFTLTGLPKVLPLRLDVFVDMYVQAFAGQGERTTDQP